jgi:hypothetical protein
MQQCICSAWATINTRLQMVCTFIGTHCNYTTCIMRSLKRISRCYWSAVDCVGRATCIVEVGWRRCCLEDCWECCCSLRLARWGVLFSEDPWNQILSWSGWFPFEAREWVDAAGLIEARWSQIVSWSSWFPLKSSPTCSSRWFHCDLQNVQREHTNCTAGMYVLTDPRHLTDCRVFIT